MPVPGDVLNLSSLPGHGLAIVLIADIGMACCAELPELLLPILHRPRLDENVLMLFLIHFLMLLKFKSEIGGGRSNYLVRSSRIRMACDRLLVSFNANFNPVLQIRYTQILQHVCIYLLHI